MPEQPSSPAVDLSVRFAGLTLKNPVIAASGTFGYGVEFEEIVALERLGAIVAKGLSLEPMAGNPAPRVWQTAAGMLKEKGDRGRRLKIVSAARRSCQVAGKEG